MNFDIDARTIILVRHGSHAYGLNTPTSDEDFKGVCIKPKDFYYGFLNTFEQYEHMGSKSDGIDKVIYSLEKFAKLAADCNPNIIECLHVDDSDIIKIDKFGEELRGIRDLFISKKAKHTFSGYSHAQLNRIKLHRSWLLNPPKAPPQRKDFDLHEQSITHSELGAFEAADDETLEFIPARMLTIFTREKQYKAAKLQFDQYQNWLKTRNPARAALEAKFGYDTKHGYHLIRLMKMCREILMSGRVHVKRVDDRDELIGIRNGSMNYDELIEYAQKIEDECSALYETSTLRHEPDRKLLSDVIVSITERYLSKHG
jgi:hypothetical protein